MIDDILINYEKVCVIYENEEGESIMYRQGYETLEDCDNAFTEAYNKEVIQ